MKSKYIYGQRAIEEAIQSGTSVDKVFIQKDLNSNIKELCFEHEIPLSRVPRVWFKKFANRNHQGHIALVSPVEFHKADEVIARLFEEGKLPLVLALDEVSDVRNFGAILRSAEAFGVDLVLIPNRGSAAINADAVKTSAGAIYNLKLARTHSLRSAILGMKQSGLQVISASEKASKAHHRVDWKLPSVLVMGSEERGVSQEVLKISDDTVSIQMIGKTASLNVSVAAGVFLSEILQQRGA